MKNCNYCKLSYPIIEEKVRIFCKDNFPLARVYDHDIFEEIECKGYKKSHITVIDRLKDIICDNLNEIDELSLINDKIRKYLMNYL